MGSRLAPLAAALVLLAAPLRAGEPDLEFEARVDALVEAARSQDAAKRKTALDGLRALGVAAIPQVLRNAGRAPGSEEWEAAVGVLLALDASQALAHVETMRSEWSTYGWREPAEGRRGKTVADELIDRLVAARSAEWSKPVRLEPVTLDDPFLVPPVAEHVVTESLPSSLLWADVATRERGAKLEIDTGGDGRFATKADAAKPLVVAVGPKDKPRRALVYRRGERWLAASPSVVRGASEGTTVEILDVEGDGDFAGAADLVRFDGGAFRPLRESPFGWTMAGLVRFRIKRDAQGWTVSLLLEPEPKWIEDVSRAELDAFQAWRSATGLAPQRIDRERTRSCGLHHEYWAKNGFSGHDEDRSKPGWTAEGERAGGSSSVWQVGNGPAFILRIAASVLHRASLLGRASDGIGPYAGGSGSMLWGSEIDAASHGFPVLVPGAGQTQVPLLCEPESPSPSEDAAFYSSAHGYPVSVTWSGWPSGVPDGRIELYEGASPKPLTGTTFSAARPYHTNYRAGFPDDSVIFLSDGGLRSNTVYTARFRGRDRDGAVEFAWQFRTR